MFSAVDVCNVLAESASIDPGAYWRKLKQRLKQEGSEVAKDARLNIEKRTGASVISSANAKDKLQLEIKPEE